MKNNRFNTAVKLSMIMLFQHMMFAVYLANINISGLLNALMLSFMAIGCIASPVIGKFADRFFSSEKLLASLNFLNAILLVFAGLGAHSLETIKACEREGIPADFYVKTFHHDKYWSAIPEENREEYSIIGKPSSDRNKYHDNMWDLFPSRTIEFMKDVNKPWIAFKVLAAGAIHPKDGFRFAFENGADFIAVGMLDFQLIDDVNTANEILGDLKKREREWFS